MTGPTPDDNEISRGRGNDESSSSPEPSPHRRSLSSSSNDEDHSVTFTDEVTSTPNEQPLLRQAVGFAWAGSTPLASEPSLKTYQATLPSTAFKEIHFLPGQEPSLSTKRSGKKRKPKVNDYGGQASRFRLKTPGPHSTAGPSQQSFTSVERVSNLSDFYFRLHPRNPKRSQTAITSSKISTEKAASERPQALQAEKRYVRGRLDSVAMPTTSKAANRPLIEEMITPSPNVTLCETESTLLADESHHRAPSGSNSAHSIDYSQSPNFGQISTSSMHTIRAAESDTAPFHMITLLIRDIRSGTTDYQLVEMSIPMKPVTEGREGFSADAKFLGRELQSSAARVDGPAKVYTMRGKYRQFFLRVSIDNMDEFISGRLFIKSNKVLDVVVEELPAPGQLPLPPRIPWDLIESSNPVSSNSERETSTSPRTIGDQDLEH